MSMATPDMLFPPLREERKIKKQRGTEEILRELREVQNRISKIKFAKDTNYEIYNEQIRKNYEFTLYTLQEICTGRETIGRFANDGYDKKLRGLVQLLLDFESDVSNDKANTELLRILREKEKLLKEELGIK